MGWAKKWPLLNETRQQLEAELGTAAFQAAWDRGQALTLEVVVQTLRENGNLPKMAFNRRSLRRRIRLDRTSERARTGCAAPDRGRIFQSGNRRPTGDQRHDGQEACQSYFWQTQRPKPNTGDCAMLRRCTSSKANTPLRPANTPDYSTLILLWKDDATPSLRLLCNHRKRSKR